MRGDRDPIWQHDNARPHSSCQTKDALIRLKSPTTQRPAYSQSLAPSDFYLFPQLKKYLKGNHYESDAHVVADVPSWCRDKSPEFFADAFHQLAQRWRLCIARDGDYVEI